MKVKVGTNSSKRPCHSSCHYQNWRCFVPCCESCGKRYDEADYDVKVIKELVALLADVERNTGSLQETRVIELKKELARLRLAYHRIEHKRLCEMAEATGVNEEKMHAVLRRDVVPGTLRNDLMCLTSYESIIDRLMRSQNVAVAERIIKSARTI